MRKHAKARGYDASKKIVGCKRHIAVDTNGRLLMVNLTPADISDLAGAQAILDAVRKRRPWVKHLFADAAYAQAHGQGGPSRLRRRESSADPTAKKT
jgi:hypothetical protein